MQWDILTVEYEYDYDKIYTEKICENYTNDMDSFYNMWIAARAHRHAVGNEKYDEYKPTYERVFREYPDYVEPIYELCETAPTVQERCRLYWLCLQCKALPHIESDEEIMQWKALAGFLVESYHLQHYDDAYDAWVELSKTSILDKVDLKYNNWVDYIKKCGVAVTEELRRKSSYAQFRWELIQLKGIKITGDNTSLVNIRFIWVKGTRTYSIIQYLAVRAAYFNLVNEDNGVRQYPRIFIYNDVEPENNEWWNKTKEYATIVHVTPPRFINGHVVPHAQHVADIMRVCIIYELGGIYLDFDLLLTKNIVDLYHDNHSNIFEPVVLCKETDNKIWNGFIAAKAGNTFLKRWIIEYETKYGDDVGGCWWAGLSVETPMRLYKKDNTDVILLDTHAFLPFGFYDDRIYTVNYIETGGFASNETSVPDPYPISYGVHLWETEAEKRGVLPKDREWFINHNSTIFTYLFGKYITDI